jgi:hypothetical protein
MAETIIYKDKIYLPREVQEQIGSAEGNSLRIEIVEKGVA